MSVSGFLLNVFLFLQGFKSNVIILVPSCSKTGWFSFLGDSDKIHDHPLPTFSIFLCGDSRVYVIKI